MLIYRNLRFRVRSIEGVVVARANTHNSRGLTAL